MWPFDRFFKEKKRPVLKRMYAAAAYNRLVADWVTSSTSADVEIRGSIRKLRDRSRQVARDNEWAVNAIQSIGNNVVGEGIRLQAQVKQLRGGKLDERTNDLIEAAWEKWTQKQNCDVRGVCSFEDIEKLLVNSTNESGEVMVRFVTQVMGNSKVPLALELIESDQLDDTYNDILPNGNYVKMGVEKNQWGRPIAYHLFAAHPGDDGFQSVYQRYPRRIRVPAEEISHFFPMKRVGQTRGVPIMAAALMRLHQMAGFEEAEVINARATSCLMGFVQTPEGEMPHDDVDETGERVTEFQPGAFKQLGPGETINVPDLHHPNGQLESFIRANLRAIAAGSGLSYETISKDYSQSNFSSTRQALLEDRKNYRIIQKWLIRNFHQIVFDRWLDLAVLSGELKLKNYEQNPDLYKVCRWLAPGWSWIDPLKDVQANREAVRSGFKSISEVISENGGDTEEVFAQIRRERELAKEYGIVLDSDPAQIDNKGAAQAAPAQEDPDGTTADPDGADPANQD
jgi:lambda family phage portal protein